MSIEKKIYIHIKRVDKVHMPTRKCLYNYILVGMLLAVHRDARQWFIISV
jgi:hypothetical protein